MKKSDFYFKLPDRLIAQYPTPERSASRLLVLSGDHVRHRRFTDFPSLLNSGDLLVFNNTKVIPARLFGEKSTGGKVELLVERLIGSHEMMAQLRVSKPPKLGSELLMEGQIRLKLLGRQNDLYHLRALNTESLLDLLEKYGHIPLPPYIKRADSLNDRERYQTIYADKPGSVAAPTAGLHFDQAILDTLQAKGVETAFVTLHVGAGTFQPIRVDNIQEHKMHAETINVSEDVCAKVAEVKARGNRVIAVGTTSVRCLETAGQSGTLEPYQGDTRIFIYPGYHFKIVDALLTNFHLPESTLLMLVAALAGYAKIMQAYQEAIDLEYRFFSYGDAMYIL